MRPIKVCFISHSSYKAGAERSLLEMIDALKEHGIKSYVVLPGYGPLTREIKKRGITYFHYSYRWWASKAPKFHHRMKTLILNVFSAIIVAKKISEWQCNIVITNTIVVFIGALAAKLLRLPHVWYIREFGFEDHGLIFHFGDKFSFKMMDFLSHACITNSNAVAKKFCNYITSSKIKVVYQSVKINNLSNKNDKIVKVSEMQCVIIGSLHEGKRQEDAIRSIAKLNKKGIGVELIIVGSGNYTYKNYLRNIVMDNKLENKIKFVGWVDNVLSFINNADVLLMCSRSEAFGRVTIEAMKLSKPVIGARSGGTSELIREGFNGLLYNVMDPNDLADKIEYLYKNPEIAKIMGENGRKWATERFNQARYGQDLILILGPLLKSISRPK